MFGKKDKPQAESEYFVIYDSKVGAYRNPMLATNRFDIIRQTESFFRDPKMELQDLCTNPEDFSIFKIGEYSKTTGVIVPTQHEHIANLHEIKSSVLRSSGIAST